GPGGGAECPANTDFVGAFLDHDDHDIADSYNSGEQDQNPHEIGHGVKGDNEPVDLIEFFKKIKIANGPIVFGIDFMPFFDNVKNLLFEFGDGMIIVCRYGHKSHNVTGVEGLSIGSERDVNLFLGFLGVAATANFFFINTDYLKIDPVY